MSQATKKLNVRCAPPQSQLTPKYVQAAADSTIRARVDSISPLHTTGSHQRRTLASPIPESHRRHPRNDYISTTHWLYHSKRPPPPHQNVDSPDCDRCSHRETVLHYLPHCPRYGRQRSRLQSSVGITNMRLSTLLTTCKYFLALMLYGSDARRIQSSFPEIPLLDQSNEEEDD